MSVLDVTPEAYVDEPVSFEALQVVDLIAEAHAVRERYRNMVISRINGDCLRLAVLEDEYPWHHHPSSDELFLVLEGRLEIDLADGRELRIEAGQCAVVPTGTIHRTRAIGRTVNLCFEQLAAETVFVNSPDPSASADR